MTLGHVLSPQTNGELGELLFALAYYPLTERLNIDVIKARDLPLGEGGQKPGEILSDGVMQCRRLSFPPLPLSAF